MTTSKLVFIFSFFLFPLCTARCAASSTEQPPQISLFQCLQIAVDHNPQLRTASTKFTEARGRVIQLHAILYPEVSAEALTTPLTFYTHVQYAAYDHARAPQLQLSRLTEDQATINYRQTLSDVIFQLRQSYTTARATIERIALLQDYADQQNKAGLTAQDLFQAGKADRATVLKTQVKINQTRQQLELSRLENTRNMLALENLLGRKLDPGVSLEPLPAAKIPEDLNMQNLVAQALRQRSDLQLLESLQLSAKEQIEIDVKEAYPTAGFASDAAIQPPAPGFSKNYDLQRNDTEPAVQRENGNTQLPLSLYVSWKIFDGGNLSGVRKTDKAEIATRDTAIVELKQFIPAEISGILATIIGARETLKSLDQSVPEENLRASAGMDWQAGRIRFLDKVNLEEDILQQRLSRLDAETRLHLAAAALDHVLGKDLREVVKTPGH